MVSSWLHRYAVFVALCTLVLLISGASVTNHRLAPSIHLAIAVTVGVLLIGLVVWLPGRLRLLGLAALALAVVDGVLEPLRALASHAFLAQMFFAFMVAIAVVTSGAWRQGPELVKDSGWPSLRSLAVVATLLVLAQAALGAGYRHGVIGLLPHFGGAMVVALVNLTACIFAKQQFPTHRSLRPTAHVVMGITFFQVFLGIAIISLGSSPGMENSLPAVVLSVTHVTTGALTLAATVIFAIQVRYHCALP